MNPVPVMAAPSATGACVTNKEVYMPKLTMTLREVQYEMRAAGIPCSVQSISAGIASGAYPFGRVVGVGPSGRRTLEVFRVDFEAWLDTKRPKCRLQQSPLRLCQGM